TAQLGGVIQIGQAAGYAVVVVPLHLFAVFGDHHTRQAVAAGRIAADHAGGVAVDLEAGVGGKTGAVGIADARVKTQGRLFAGLGQGYGLLRVDIGRVEEFQIGVVEGQLVGVGHAVGVVFGGKLGDAVCRFHRFADG